MAMKPATKEIFNYIKAHDGEDFTAKDIAEALGMTNSVFSGMLNGRKVIQASYLPCIVKAVGCSYDDLFRQPESQPT